MPDALIPPLMRWYARRRRALPWRDDPTPYKVLLSELMLQQTRVDTVIPHFERFLARWPTLEHLARATEEEVVEQWAGLGYYRRARHLHRCAVAAVALGGLPQEAEALRKLPGIGPYTAGAIASIAFGRRAPLVDGNVERVLSRIGAITEDPRKAAGKRILWEMAGSLHARCDDSVHPGDLNQALMELGATVCTPRAPGCGSCPVASACEGRETPERYPTKSPRTPPRPIQGAAGRCVQEGRWLLGRREPGGLLGGLWEPIRVQCAPAEGQGSLREAYAALGLGVEVGPAEGEVVHVFSHRILTLRVHPVRWVEGQPRPGVGYDRVEWASPASAGLSALARKVLAFAPSPHEESIGLPLAAEPG